MAGATRTRQHENDREAHRIGDRQTRAVEW
jgi:hypothetical protein